MSDGQTFCIYCQAEYSSPKSLRRHIERLHPGSYAYFAVNMNDATEVKQDDIWEGYNLGHLDKDGKEKP